MDAREVRTAGAASDASRPDGVEELSPAERAAATLGIIGFLAAVIGGLGVLGVLLF